MKKKTIIILSTLLLLPMCISVSAETFDLFVPPEYGFTNYTVHDDSMGHHLHIDFYTASSYNASSKNYIDPLAFMGE